MSSAHSAKTVQDIEAAWHEVGTSASEVAAKCGVGKTTALKYKPVLDLASKVMIDVSGGITEVQNFTQQYAPPSTMYPVPKSAVAEMRRAAEASDEFDEPIESVWRREEVRGAKAIGRAKEVAQFKFNPPGKHCMIAFVSDMHIAPGTPVDFRKMRADAELIRDTPGLYCVLAGDQVDNHIKHRSAILASRSQPEDQYKLFEYYLSIIGSKCLVVTSGNHDDWTNNFAGVDVLGRIVRDRRVHYSPDEAWIDLEVGGQKYVIAVRHQYRFGSQFNQTHTVKQWLRLGPREFDVGVIGHHHEAAIEQTIYRDKFRWVARPGSYQITSAYSRQLGFNHAIPTCPTFLFHGDEHDITGWKSVEAMARSLKALKTMGAAA